MNAPLPVMSPTAHSRSPARIRSSISTVSGVRVEADGLETDVGEVVASGRPRPASWSASTRLAVDPEVEGAVVVDPLDLDAGPDVDALVAQDPR